LKQLSMAASDGAGDIQFFTMKQIAMRWSCSEEKAARVFRGRPGVLDLGSAEDYRKNKRRYSILRVPPSILAEVEAEFTEQ
jgi:hypothetical protein